MKKTALRRFEISGTPKQMGEGFGEQFRELIRPFYETRLGHLREFVAEQADGKKITPAFALACAQKTLPYHETYDKNLWLEFSSIARAAGLSREELLLCNGYTDLKDYVLIEASPELSEARAGAAPEAAVECSAFAAPAEATGAYPIVGQTWDMNPDALDFLLLVHRKPKGAPETLCLTTAGCLCLIGINSEGVAVGNNNLIPTDARPGVNYLFTITRALACTSAAKAAKLVETTRRLSGHNFYVADRREAYNIETTAEEAVVTRVEKKTFVHTNHYLSPTLKPLELPGRDLKPTCWRYDRLKEGFSARARKEVTLESAWALLSDDERGDGAVCNEDYQCEHGNFATVATVVMNPGHGKMWACRGGAKSGLREEFSL